MKVELLVTLKGSKEELFGKGDIFSDPIPTTLLKEIELGRNTVRIIESNADIAPQQQEEIVKEAELAPTPPPPPAPSNPTKRSKGRTLKK